MIAFGKQFGFKVSNSKQKVISPKSTNNLVLKTDVSIGQNNIDYEFEMLKKTYIEDCLLYIVDGMNE